MTKELIQIIKDCPSMEVDKKAKYNYNHVKCNSAYECPYQTENKVNYCWKHLMIEPYKGEKNDN